MKRSLSFLSPATVLCGLGNFTYLSGKTIGELPALMPFSAVSGTSKADYDLRFRTRIMSAPRHGYQLDMPLLR